MEEAGKPDKTTTPISSSLRCQAGGRTRVWEVCLPACLFLLLLTKFLEQAREVPVAERGEGRRSQLLGVGGASKEGCEDQRGRQNPDKSQTKQETPTPKPD